MVRISKKKSIENIEIKLGEIEQSHNKKRREENANRVIDAYLKMHLSSKNNGIGALFTAGMASLEDEDQAKMVINRIENQISKSPLGRYHEKINDLGILVFFKNTTWLEINELKGVDNAIENIKAKIGKEGKVHLIK